MQTPSADAKEDPFCFETNCLKETNALKSSLWELNVLSSHYHPKVSRAVKIFHQSLGKKKFDLEEHFGNSYSKVRIYSSAVLIASFSCHPNSQLVFLRWMFLLLIVQQEFTRQLRVKSQVPFEYREELSKALVSPSERPFSWIGLSASNTDEQM